MSRIYEHGLDEAIRRLDNPDRIRRHDPRTLLPMMGLAKGMDAADLGCGTGFWTITAAEIVGKGGLVYAVDQVGAALDVLRAKVANLHITNVKIIESDLCRTSIPSSSVDFVLFACVLHHVRENALPEVERVLRPRGKLCIVDWKKAATSVGPPIGDRMSDTEVATLLETNGWKVHQKLEVSDTHYGMVARLRGPPRRS